MRGHRPDKQKYHLSPSEIDEIVERGNENEMKGSTLDNLQDTVELQINRWQYLLNDTAYLYSAGILSTQYWDDGWDEVGSLGFPKESGIRPEKKETEKLIPPEKSTSYYFGEILGKLAQMYYVGLNEEPSIDDISDIMSGFALNIFTGHDDHQRQQAIVDRFIQSLREESVHQHIDETLDDMSLPGTTDIDESISEIDFSQITDIDTSFEVGKTEEVDLFPSDILKRWLECYAIEQRIGVSTHPDEMKLVIEKELLNYEPFRNICLLDRAIRADIAELENKKAGHTPAVDVFEDIWKNSVGEQKSTIKIDDINSYSNEPKKNINIISNVLSGKGMRDDRWHNRPALNKNPGNSGAKCRLTVYGELLGVCYMIEQPSDYLHRYGLSYDSPVKLPEPLDSADKTAIELEKGTRLESLKSGIDDVAGSKLIEKAMAEILK